MGKKRPGGQLAARPLHFIWVTDCSGSMKDHGKMNALNAAIRDVIPHMQRVADENPNAQVLLRAVKFSSGAHWHISKPTPLADFQWTDLGPAGRTDMGKALTLVADEMRMPPMTDRALPPVLVLVSDGRPTDDFLTGLQALLGQPWGKKAVRIAVAIGEDADLDVLQQFIGHDRLKPLQANTPEALIKQIKWASTAVLRAVSAPVSQAAIDNGGNVPLPPALAEDPDDPGLWGAAAPPPADADRQVKLDAAPPPPPPVTQPRPARPAGRPKPAPPMRKFGFETVTVDEKGAIRARRPGTADCYAENLSGGVQLEMVAIPPGTFTMGSPMAELERMDSEGPPHKVSVPAFYLGKFPVTQAQWREVAALPKVDRRLDPDISHFRGNDLPAESITWQDALEFCARLSTHTGRHYRLPTEAEWEYACRSGTTTPFHWGQTITAELANFDGDYPYGQGPKGPYLGKTTPVGSVQLANDFGLYDMHGNVFEWCADPWHDNYQDAPSDGSAWEMGGADMRRVVRGGSWGRAARGCRSACRVEMVLKNDVWFALCVYVGLRVACS